MSFALVPVVMVIMHISIGVFFGQTFGAYTAVFFNARNVTFAGQMFLKTNIGSVRTRCNPMMSSRMTTVTNFGSAMKMIASVTDRV
jgi:hypothetical protein